MARAERERRGWARAPIPEHLRKHAHAPVDDRQAVAQVRSTLAQIPGVFQVDSAPNSARAAFGAFAQDFPALIEQTFTRVHALGLIVAQETRLGYRLPRSQKRLLARLLARNVVRLIVLDASGRRLLRLRLELWTEDELNVTSPGPNPISTSAPKAWFRERVLSNPAGQRVLARLVPAPLTTEPDFDVDVVYTWVNDQDPDWKLLYEANRGDRPPRDATSLARFLNRNELLYSLRSIDEFAPWVRNIYVLTNCSPPPWVNLEHPRLFWVTHEQVFPSTALPTFNSHAIESRLHHIPGLSKHFLYFNDDFLLSKPARKGHFFSAAGLCLPKLESWGRVNGPVQPGDPDYLNAARLGQTLLFERFGKAATQLHQHTAYALRVDLLAELEAHFPDEFARTAHARFRSTTDISVASFLSHHYALVRAQAAHLTANVALVQARNAYRARFRRLLAGRSTSPAKLPLTVCINDGEGSADNDDWNRAVTDFLQTMYPRASQFEK